VYTRMKNAFLLVETWTRFLCGHIARRKPPYRNWWQLPEVPVKTNTTGLQSVLLVDGNRVYHYSSAQFSRTLYAKIMTTYGREIFQQWKLWWEVCFYVFCWNIRGKVKWTNLIGCRNWSSLIYIYTCISI
jgi:hypothetical protein